MKLTVRPLDCAQMMNGKVRLQFETFGKLSPEQYEQYTKWLYEEKKLTLDIKPYRAQRSLDANAYLWVICQKIAEAIGNTKENVYKKFIRDVGQFEILPIREDAVEYWINVVWGGRGLGWYAEVIEDSKLPGYKKVINYLGSSIYNTEEMSVLIDEVVTQAKALGIETLPPAEIASMKDLWEKHK